MRKCHALRRRQDTAANAFQGGTYSLAVAAVVLAILIAVNASGQRPAHHPDPV
ncbi:MAG: hypothetical protein ACLRWQ_01925 [Flavonifractor plautii]